MTEFLKTLVEKFLDFFNFGRFFTILIPGFCVALCLSMFFSLLLFPVQESSISAGKKDGATESGGAGASVEEQKNKLLAKGYTNVAAVKRLPVFVLQSSAKTSSSAEKKKAVQQGISSVAVINKLPVVLVQTIDSGRPSVTEGKRPDVVLTRCYSTSIQKEREIKEIECFKSRFQKQISADFKRISSNYMCVVILSIVIGFLLYLTSNRVICACSPKKDDYKLYPYDIKDSNKFVYVQPNKEKTNDVGLIYFAPFLKEKFSGDNNYYTFLILEYYRFVELSVVMPLSLLLSIIISALYYVVLSICIGKFIYIVGFIGMFAIEAIIVGVFLKYVIPVTIDNYKKSTKELIDAVTYVMSKGLAPKGDG